MNDEEAVDDLRLLNPIYTSVMTACIERIARRTAGLYKGILMKDI